MAEDWLNAYIAEVTGARAQKVREALLKVTDKKRRLLALRGYLRTQRNIDTDWAWSNEQANDFRESIAYKDLVTQIDLVKTEFAKANAGFRLTNSRLIRDLPTQLKLWNDNASVGTAASTLWSLAEAEVAKPNLKQPTPTTASATPVKPTAAPTTPVKPTADQVKAFTKFLRQSSPGTIMVATPGLSDHGHANAVDFTVREADSDTVIAGASKAHIEQNWDKDGYTKALKDAVTAAGDRFEGPLQSPYEPWHYTITWETDALEVPLVHKCLLK
jgi:hypothetical protein